MSKPHYIKVSVRLTKAQEMNILATFYRTVGDRADSFGHWTHDDIISGITAAIAKSTEATIKAQLSTPEVQE